MRGDGAAHCRSPEYGAYRSPVGLAVPTRPSPAAHGGPRNSRKFWTDAASSNTRTLRQFGAPDRAASPPDGKEHHISALASVTARRSVERDSKHSGAARLGRPAPRGPGGRTP